MKRRLLAGILSLVMVLSLLPTAVLAEEVESLGEVKTSETGEDSILDPALQDAEEGSTPAFQIAPEGGIVISENTTWDTPGTLTENLTVNDGVTLTIGAQVTVSGNVTISGGGTIMRASAYTGSLLVVTDGSSLTLANIIIDGGAIWTGDEDETLKRGTVNDGLTADSALVTVNGGTLTLNEGTLIQNNERTVGTAVEEWIEYQYTNAKGEEATRYYAVGGGVSVVGGSLIVNNGAVVKNNTIKDSEKVNEATSDAMGGGIGLYDCASLVVNGGEISGNQAQTSGTARAMGGGIGMAAHPDSPYGTCKVCFNGGELKNNLSVTSGGGAYFTSDCVDETGIGALDVSFSGGTIAENKAVGDGGGIIVWGGKAALSEDVAFTNNQAPNGSGGGAYFSKFTSVSIDGGSYSNNKSNHGGGIAWNVGSKFEFRNGTVSKNTATMTGGGLYLSNNTAETSAVISGGIISENTATGGAGVWADYVTISGGTISQNHADGNGQSGGGVYANHIFKLSGTGTITENSAYTGGGVYIGHEADSSFEITGGTISKNRATGGVGGGGIYSAKVTSNDDVTSRMTGGIITENVAETGSGGGLYLRGKFELEGGTISKNSAPLLAGGGVNVYSGAEMVITDGIISNNEAYEAAGIRVTGTLTMNGGTVEENCAKPIYDVTTQKGKENNNGGGVSVGKDATFIMNAGLIQKNTAKYGAGISAWQAKQFEIHGGEISENRTENMTYSKGNSEMTVNGTYGAGINLGGNTTLLITGGKIINNTANSYGGGINVPVGNAVKISGVPVITENTVNNAANNVYLRHDSKTNGNSVIDLAGKLESGSVIGVKTEQTPTASANSPLQITTAETDTVVYYKDAARYFIPDAANVIAQANDTGKYVELAYTADTYHKVTLNLTHATATGGLTTQVKENESYSAAVTADIGYTLPATLADLDTYTRTADNRTANIGISHVAADKTIEITAVPNTYTVQFDANDGTGTMNSQTMTYNKYAELSKNAFTQAGYNFAGWSDSEDGTVKYPDGASVKNMTTENGATVTLYAVWSKKDVLPAFDSSDSAVQANKYDGTAKTYQLISAVDGFSITYKQGGIEVAAPTNVGTYDVVITRDEDATYAAFSQTITGGLVITAADYPITINADQSTMTGSGTVKLTASSSVAGITVTGITCSDSSVVITQNTNGTYSAALPNATKTYTFTAQVEGDLSNYGEGPATCTVSVTCYVPSAPGSSVTVPATSNGNVTVSPSTASKGTTVTVTTKPNEGYELGSLEVLDKNGNALALKDLGNGKYSFTMPDGKVSVNASFVKASVSTGFADVPANAYYADAVKWAVDKGVTNGLSANLFGPYEPCTRAQIVTFLWRAAGSPEPKATTSKMTDLDPNAYYYKAVLWAIENGITSGMTDTTFAPNATCTRGQSVTFLYRALGKKVESSTSFTDVKSDAFYADAVNWAVANNVTNGTSATTFSPNADCTRAEIVTFLYRAYQGK